MKPRRGDNDFKSLTSIPTDGWDEKNLVRCPASLPGANLGCEALAEQGEARVQGCTRQRLKEHAWKVCIG
jgi:hypothetical protein